MDFKNTILPPDIARGKPNDLRDAAIRLLIADASSWDARENSVPLCCSYELCQRLVAANTAILTDAHDRVAPSQGKPLAAWCSPQEYINLLVRRLVWCILMRPHVRRKLDAQFFFNREIALEDLLHHELGEIPATRFAEQSNSNPVLEDLLGHCTDDDSVSTLEEFVRDTGGEMGSENA